MLSCGVTSGNLFVHRKLEQLSSRKNQGVYEILPLVFAHQQFLDFLVTLLSLENDSNNTTLSSSSISNKVSLSLSSKLIIVIVLLYSKEILFFVFFVPLQGQINHKICNFEPVNPPQSTKSLKTWSRAAFITQTRLNKCMIMPCARKWISENI